MRSLSRTALIACCALATLVVRADEWTDWLERMPQPVLSEEYHSTCRRPCEYIGFSFTGPIEELRDMQASGANSVGLGAMWNPVKDPEAPYGCGARSPAGAGVLGQRFTAKSAFDALAPCLPTGFSKDSGCSWRLYSVAGEDLHAKLPAEGTWEIVADNSWPEADTGPMDPGQYYFEIHTATGSWIGWWAQTGDPAPDGVAYVSDKRDADLDFELRARLDGKWSDITPMGGEHEAVNLGPLGTAVLQRVGMSCNYSVGNWNNPGFPYYPDWFIEQFPETIAIDHNGNPIMGGMFGKSVPAPNIESAVIVDGTNRFIRATVAGYRDAPNLRYWVMGGEALYATYCYGTRWTDYSDNALQHFRAWLASHRYRSIDELNRAWRTSYARFTDVEAPRQPAVSRPWLDWLDFRFVSMGERFCRHYQATRSEDPERLIVTCNHGTLYQGDRYAAMGARPELFAAASDGFETGQIMSDADPDLYNIMYMETLNTLGKPYCPVRLAYKKSDPKARGGGTSYTPEAARRYVYESLGGDAWHLGLIQWSGSLPDGEWGVVGTPAEKEIATLWSEIRSLWPVLEDMHAVQPRVGVFLSHPVWALKGFLPEWRNFHVAAVESQVPKLYVYDEQIKSGGLDDFDVVLSIGNSIVDPAVAKALADYARDGGKLIIAGQFATQDAWGEAISEDAPAISKALRTPRTDADSILRILGESVQPVRVETDQTVSRRQELDIAPSAQDLPLDMRVADSLGQTFKVPYEGLERISIRTPTFYQKPEFGFLLEVLRDDPDGEVIARREVPGGMADNSWQDIEIATPIPAGAALYVRATADTRIPKLHVGWWSTRLNQYVDGQAFIDDMPVEGDRQVLMTFSRPISAARAVELFVLSDGLNFGVVCINTAEHAISARLDLTALAAGAPAPGHSVECPVAPETWKADGLTGTLDLPAHGAAFLYLRHRTDAASAASLVHRAERARDAWRKQDAATDFVEYATGKAREQLDAGRPEKAAAMALKVLRQMGMRATVTVGETVSVSAECFGPDGEPVRPTQALCSFVPTQGFHQAPDITDDGRLSLELRRTATNALEADLPTQYDYAAKQYRPFRGPLRIHITANAPGMRGQCVRDITLD